MQMIVGLLPVVVGGLIGAGSVYFGSYITHRLEQKSMKKDFKRMKLELLVTRAHQTMQWLDDYKDELLLGGNKAKGEEFYNEFQMLSALYFPELSNECVIFELKILEFKQWALDGKKILLKGEPISAEFTAQFTPVYARLSNALTVLRKKAASIIQDDEQA